MTQFHEFAIRESRITRRVPDTHFQRGHAENERVRKQAKWDYIKAVAAFVFVSLLGFIGIGFVAMYSQSPPELRDPFTSSVAMALGLLCYCTLFSGLCGIAFLRNSRD